MSEWIAKLDVYLHDEKCFGVNLLEKIEKKTNCPRKFIVLGLGALVVIWLMVGYGAEFFSNFIGFLYPAYASIKAIESKEKDDDTKWLTYWVVYSSFMLLEFFSDIFLFWIPFYWLLKCLFMVYCFAPAKWNGSITIYQKIIRPFILKYETKIDDIIDRGVQRAKDGLDEGRKLVEEAESEIAKKHLD